MPILTLLLVALNALAYQAELEAGGQLVCDAFGLIPARPETHAVFAYMFLHDPSSLTHILSNMAVLLVAGIVVERAVGSLLFGCLYLAAGVCAAALHVLVSPLSENPLVGASGAVFGLLPLFALLCPRALGFVVSLAAVNVWQSVTGTGGDVSVAGHIGGLAVGVLIAGALKLGGHEAFEEAA